MRNKSGLPVILLLCLTVSTIHGQSRQEFIQKYKHIAIQEMERTGIPASITLAQGIFESGCGMSQQPFRNQVSRLGRPHLSHG